MSEPPPTHSSTPQPSPEGSNTPPSSSLSTSTTSTSSSSPHSDCARDASSSSSYHDHGRNDRRRCRRNRRHCRECQCRGRRHRTRPYRVLTVGDGDLTYTLSLARAYGSSTSTDERRRRRLHLIGSTILPNRASLVAAYPNSDEVLTELNQRKVHVLYGLDATDVEKCLIRLRKANTTEVQKEEDDGGEEKDEEAIPLRYDAILFNHPHLGVISSSSSSSSDETPTTSTPNSHLRTGDDERLHALRHQSLLSHYFHSASRCVTASAEDDDCDEKEANEDGDDNGESCSKEKDCCCDHAGSGGSNRNDGGGEKSGVVRDDDDGGGDGEDNTDGSAANVGFRGDIGGGGGGGLVHLCLCGTQPQTWDVLGAASRAGLRLVGQHGTASPVHEWLGLAGVPSSTSTLASAPASASTQAAAALSILVPNPPQPHHAAPRRYRNGKLGSFHFLGKYGYRHRRTGGDLLLRGTSATAGSVTSNKKRRRRGPGDEGNDVNVSQSVNFLFSPTNHADKTKETSSSSSIVVVGNEEETKKEEEEEIQHGCHPPSLRCRICDRPFQSQSEYESHLRSPARPNDELDAAADAAATKAASAIATKSAAAMEEEEEEDEATVVLMEDGTTTTTTGRPAATAADNDDGDGDEDLLLSKQNDGDGKNNKTTTSSLKKTAPDDKENGADMILASSIVSSHHHGKRLRWYCRRPSADGAGGSSGGSGRSKEGAKRLSSFCVSKKKTDDLIKQGRIHVNGSAAFDSGRILKAGDVVSVVNEENSSSSSLGGDGGGGANKVVSVSSSSGGVAKALLDGTTRHRGEASVIATLRRPRSIKEDEDSGVFIVAYKPVGLRSTGTFARTLETVVPSLLTSGVGSNGAAAFGRRLESHSRLETGCAGLCVMRVASASVDGSVDGGGRHCLSKPGDYPSPIVTYVFTALVHGLTPSGWAVGDGAWFDLPREGVRRWKRKASGGGGQVEQALSPDLQGAEESAACVDEGILKGTDPCYNPAAQGVFIRCTESTHREGHVVGSSSELATASMQHLSTVEITTTANTGRLCNALCYLLRRLGYPVVNDRFCKKEFASLPRPIRNVLKNKLCIGCYRLEIDWCEKEKSGVVGDRRVVSIAAPARLSALRWSSCIIT